MKNDDNTIKTVLEVLDGIQWDVDPKGPFKLISVDNDGVRCSTLTNKQMFTSCECEGFNIWNTVDNGTKSVITDDTVFNIFHTDKEFKYYEDKYSIEVLQHPLVLDKLSKLLSKQLTLSIEKKLDIIIDKLSNCDETISTEGAFRHNSKEGIKTCNKSAIISITPPLICSLENLEVSLSTGRLITTNDSQLILKYSIGGDNEIECTENIRLEEVPIEKQDHIRYLIEKIFASKLHIRNSVSEQCAKNDGKDNHVESA